NHREEDDQKRNNSPRIETLYLFPIHGGSHHDFFGVKALDLSSNHSVGVAETKGKPSRQRAKEIERAESTAKNDDIIDEEDPIPYDLADSDDEDLVNLDIDDGVNVVYSNVARGHGGDGDGDDRPSPYQISIGCGVCLGNRVMAPKNPIWVAGAGRMHTRQETRNLGLKAIPYKNGPVLIRFEFGNRETLMPLGDHAAHWVNYLGELVRKLSLYYPSWRQMPLERKAGVVAYIGHLQKIYNGKKAVLKERYWVPDEDGTYDVERIRRGRPSHIFELESSATREYPSLIHTFFLTYTVGGVFLNLKDKALYDEMLRLHGLGSNTPSGFCRDRARSFRPRLHARTPSKQVNMFMKLFRSDNKFFQMLTQLESQPEYDSGSGSGGCRDDELGDVEDGSEDEEDEDDS
nr:hypothetical protein [Tanacetum cinerariifolium]